MKMRKICLFLYVSPSKHCILAILSNLYCIFSHLTFYLFYDHIRSLYLYSTKVLIKGSSE